MATLLKKPTVVDRRLSINDRGASGLGKSQGDRRPPAGLAFDLGTAAVQIHNRFHEGEAEAHALRAARGISAIETIEDARQMLLRDSSAVVFHRDF